LPLEAQMAPINAILAEDFYPDGHIDLLLAGNEYQEAVANGRYDASYGLLLKGNGKGGFTAIPPVRSGFIIDGDVRNTRMIRNGKKERIVIAGVNDDSVRCFRWNK
jgi:enediyne biosynthesis protein E4